MLSLLLVLTLASTSHAAQKEAVVAPVGVLTSRLPFPAYLGVDLSMGYASSVPAAGIEAPALVKFDLGLIAAYSFEKLLPGYFGGFLAGLRMDFQWINQYSNTTASGGNHRGYRWNIVSPVVGYRIARFLTTVDFQFLGHYSLLTAESFSGSAVVFKGPLGFRWAGSYRVWDGLRLGASADYTTFGARSSVSGVDVSLSSRKVFWQLGLLAIYDL